MLNPARSRAVCRWRRKMFVSCQQGEVNSGSQFHFSIPPFVQSGTPARMFVPPTCRIAFPSVHLFWELPETCLPADSKSGHPGSKDWLSQILGRTACYRLLLF